MNFGFRRKYNNFFLFFILLSIVSVGFSWLLTTYVNNGTITMTTQTLQIIYVLLGVNLVIFSLAFLVLSKKVYHIDVNGFTSSAVLSKSFTIPFEKIVSVKRSEERVFLMFGKISYLSLTFLDNKSTRTITIRTDRPDLLYKYLANEKEVHKVIKYDNKKTKHLS